MKRILLCCSAGMSTSMLVKKMEAAATEQGIECKIDALSVIAFEGEIQNYDVCLLGLQVRFQLEEMKKVTDQYGINIAAIPPQTYGMMKGDEALKQVLSLIK